ncbi:MAG TPA: DUF5674 family protein [Candidatus Babeliales bacterium]|nr:DUF5674 family protein [Candidatus Babeliales bacterium]
MQIVCEKVTLDELKKMSEKMYNRIVKAVVDVEKGIMVIDMEMHADGEMFMLENESMQENLWGINIHPELEGDMFIEFDSVINIRPSQENRTRGVDNTILQNKIKKLVARLVVK